MNEITIRKTMERDELALRRLAALDSHRPLRGAALVAEVGGELLAAEELDTGRVIADPFRHTAALTDLLRLRAAQEYPQLRAA